MKTLRRVLGILVMIAGILGLVLSLAGLVSVWVVKPTIATSLNSTITTLNSSIDASKETMVVTEQALAGMVGSVEALQTMLASTATTIQDTNPLIDSLTGFIGDQLPKTVTAASDSLKSAQQAAAVLDSAIKNLNTFQNVLSGIPFLNSLVTLPKGNLNSSGGKPLADSLVEIATEMQDLPKKFSDMATDLSKATSNLSSVQTSLTTMSTNIGGISTSLEQYKNIIANSQGSMDNLKLMLTNFQDNLNRILNIAAIVLTLFFLWLLAAQVVILSQGWELYQGTTDRME